ncbi:MAG: 50S ribosomal protein L6 [Saprospiraceae bacterium]|nr:50S ribosomal protein L6 [Saprospiraceae bacterium]
MSRVGKSPIEIPAGVEVQVGENNVVKVKGPKGELLQKVDADLEVKIDGNIVTIERPTEQKRHKSAHGLYRSLINNMVVGVSEGYKIELELHGVGYRASSSGNKLELALGYSHPIVFLLPPEVKVSAEMQKGQPPMVTLESHDKQLIGQVAAKIRSTRKPEPYKGKGIRFKGEQIRRKAGKAAAK